jgi:hypothetical protein
VIVKASLKCAEQSLAIKVTFFLLNSNATSQTTTMVVPRNLQDEHNISHYKKHMLHVKEKQHAVKLHTKDAECLVWEN